MNTVIHIETYDVCLKAWNYIYLFITTHNPIGVMRATLQATAGEWFSVRPLQCPECLLMFKSCSFRWHIQLEHWSEIATESRKSSKPMECCV